jgi:hypothetical protein
MLSLERFEVQRIPDYVYFSNLNAVFKMKFLKVVLIRVRFSPGFSPGVRSSQLTKKGKTGFSRTGLPT